MVAEAVNRSNGVCYANSVKCCRTAFLVFMATRI